MARGDFGGRPEQVVHEGVDRDFHLAPGPLRLVKPRALSRFPLLAHDLPDALQFLRHLLVGGNDLIERVRDLPFQPRPVTRQPHGKVAVAHGLQAREQDAQLGGGHSGMTIGMCLRSRVSGFLRGGSRVTVFLRGGGGVSGFLHGGGGRTVFLHGHAPE